MNNNCVSASVLKTLEFSRVHSTSEIFRVLNPRDEIYLVFTEQVTFFFLFCTFRRLTVNRVKLQSIIKVDKGFHVTEYLDQAIVIVT